MKPFASNFKIKICVQHTGSMQHHTLLDMAVRLLQSSRSAVQLRQYTQARDSCIQCVALLDLGISSNPGDVAIFQAYKSMVTEIAEQVTELKNQPIVPLVQSMISDEDAQEEKPEVFLPEQEDLQKVISNGFSQVLGCHDAKSALFENIILPMEMGKSTKSNIFNGIRAGNGNVLLHGPPGTGKTLLAHATAAEAHAAFYEVHPSDILSKYQGESERYLKSLFQKARSQPRAIIFFDEFDCIATSRGSCGGDDGGGVQARRLLSELLVQMTRSKQLQQQQVTKNSNSDLDHAEEYGSVVVLAATNRLIDLDEAVMRRFEAKVYVPVPDALTRFQMIQRHMTGLVCALQQNEFEKVVDLVLGWSGSDIEILCREAAMTPVREVLSYNTIARDISIIGKRQRAEPSPSGSVSYANAAVESASLHVRAISMQDFVEAHTRLLLAPDGTEIAQVAEDVDTDTN